MESSAHPRRLERLSPLDVSNLRVEDRSVPMQVAALAIVEGAPLLDANGQPRLDLLREHLQRRLPLAPRLRQVLVRPHVGLGPPLWVDDARFDLRQHVQTRAVPAPGDEPALLKLCAELNQPPLDWSRPLWQLWVLSGLVDGRVGLLVRFHHVVADGIAALALLGALFDATPDPPAPAAQPWTPGPAPSGWELLADNLRRRRGALAGVWSGMRRPGVLLDRLWWLVRQVGRVARQELAPRVSLNRPVGTRRRLALVRADLGCAKAVAHAHRATVNDVVLAAVAGGARRLLAARGELRPGLVLHAAVAASIRRPAEARAGGNRVGILLVPLPVGEPDPFRRLAQIVVATAEAKRRPVYQPSGRLLQRWMVRAMVHQRLVHLFVSNLSGPPMPLYLAGARVLEVFQVGVVQGNVPLGMGVLSYAGQLNFDLVSDADAVPDAAVFAAGLSDALHQLGAGSQEPPGLAGGGGGDGGTGGVEWMLPSRSRWHESFGTPSGDMGKEDVMPSRRVPGLAVLALVGYDRVVRPWLRGWGATNGERREPLPGDALVRGRYQSTHAITIGAPPAQVWPWVVQLGYGRGGWYSYDRLERAVGAGEFAEGGSARRIVGDLQSLAVSDTVLLSPNGGLTVVGLEAPRSLVLHYRMDAFSASPVSEQSRGVLDWTWAFVLRPVAEGCRLLVRVRVDPWPWWLQTVLPLLEAAHWVMERKMLLGLKQRAEQRAPQRPSVTASMSTAT